MKNINELTCIPEGVYGKDDITVVIGDRDRYDHRIENTLESISRQEYDNRLIKVIIVDYGSKKKFLPKLGDVCEKYGAMGLRVNTRSMWSRGHCLNIGIKRARTRYILTCDSDILFEKNYIGELIKELKKDPYQAIYCSVMDSPKGTTDKALDLEREYDRLREEGEYRGLDKTFPYGVGMLSTLTCFFHAIHGYDLEYRGWGFEDIDIVSRFASMGLRINNLLDKTSYIHQWHPKYQGISRFRGRSETIRKNSEYFYSTSSIVRNDENWGEDEVE